MGTILAAAHPSPHSLDCLLKNLREFFRIAPSNDDHRPAIRIAIGVGVPLLTLLAIGRVDLSIFAVLGAFTGVFGREEHHRERLAQQWRASVLLLLAVTAGILTSRISPPPGAIVAFTAAVAGLGFVASSNGRLKPAGSFFYVFAYSAVAFMPFVAMPWLALATSGASALVCLLLGVTGRTLPGHSTPWDREPRLALSASERAKMHSEALLHVGAVTLAGVVALLAGFGHSYWAMIAATVPLVGATMVHRIRRGLHRILGTGGGLAIAGVLLGLPLLSWQFILIALGLQFCLELFVTRNYALAQVFVTPLALIMTEVANPANPWLLIRDRGIETVIGATVGIVLVMAASAVASKRAARAVWA